MVKLAGGSMSPLYPQTGQMCMVSDPHLHAAS
jgi:hypothetical protein